MFALHTACSFFILINLTCLPFGTFAVPASAVGQNSAPNGAANASNVVTEVTITSGPLAEANSSTNNPAELMTSANEIVEINVTTTTPTTTPETTSEQSIKCKTNSEVYSNCSNSCPASCEDPTRTPCRQFCWSGCECAPGYVKNHRWQCIPIEDCPKCAPNEHYRNCGPNCEPTCDTYQNTPVHCSNRASCKRGCFCDYGFVRDMDKNGQCVPIAECPQKCGLNEYWDVSGEPCIRSADNPRPKCLFEAPKAACVCNTGFKRNPTTKQCEPISSIAEKFESKCSANETYSHCDSECARQCFDENKRQFCPTICHRGCFCNNGYRRDNSGRCVLPEDCRSWNSYPTAVWRV